jgi:hypothetical protein
MLTRNAGGGGWLVKCDGCGRETLAEVFPDRVVVYDKRHGQKHIAVIPRCELLKIMGACTIACLADPDSGSDNEECSQEPNSASAQTR